MSPSASFYLAVLAALLGGTSASVLPRPPSSSGNHVAKNYDDKRPQDVSQSTNVERPDTNDYRLVEIEVEDSDDAIVAANLPEFVNAMLADRNQRGRLGRPKPEVVPNSMLGVRSFDVAPELPHFRMDDPEHGEEVPRKSPKLQHLDEKLYYLKDGRPKVYVNVRGRSGSFVKDKIARKIDSRTVARGKGTQSPDKSRQKLEETLTEDRFNDLSTTEVAMITSSELPKQIPAPPNKLWGRLLMTQTTPVQRYPLRRIDALPGYNVSTD